MKQVFMSDDGKSFDTAEACAEYEQMGEKRAVIKKWADETFKDDKKGSATRAYNGAIRWEAVRESVLTANF
jgi:hypothetical protein